jgi:uncharacterized membrane protein YecN with MAPEG domain
MAAPITALYAGLFGLLIVALAALVVRQRVKCRVNLGIGDAAPLERAIRVHGNCVEYVPVALLLLLIAEINGGAAGMLHAYGATLLAARVLHAIGLSRTDKPNACRFLGTVITWLVVVGLAAGGLLGYAKG